MTPVELRFAEDESEFGGKAVQLGAAVRAGLPVPDGFALSHTLVDAAIAGNDEACGHVVSLERAIDGPVAVRSSGVGEDGLGSSFAGQHVSVLNVRGGSAVLDALHRVHESGRTASALAYRRRMRIPGNPRVAAVVQRLVDPVCAGVMFTRDPMTGADVRMIEASWGLGEAVVQGIVTPDRFRVARDGTVIARHAGNKDLAVRRNDQGGTCEVEVTGDDVTRLCLTDAHLAELSRLAGLCEEVFGAGRDIEWALADGKMVILQVRAITSR